MWSKGAVMYRTQLSTENIEEFIYGAPYGSVSVILYHSRSSSCKKCIQLRDQLDELENELFDLRLRFATFDVTSNTLSDDLAFPELPSIALTKKASGEIEEQIRSNKQHEQKFRLPFFRAYALNGQYWEDNYADDLSIIQLLIWAETILDFVADQEQDNSRSTKFVADL